MSPFEKMTAACVPAMPQRIWLCCGISRSISYDKTLRQMSAFRTNASKQAGMRPISPSWCLDTLFNAIPLPDDGLPTITAHTMGRQIAPRLYPEGSQEDVLDGPA